MLLYVIIKNSKKLILGVNRVMDEISATEPKKYMSVESIFLEKGKKELTGKYERIFDDDDLNSKKLAMLNDEKNGEKYFNNLVCILELLDFLSTKKNLDDYNKCIGYIKKSDQNELVEAIKNFVPTENDYMVVLEDKEGNRFETPGIQICSSFTVFEDETSMLSCSPDNTCKSEEFYQEQYSSKKLKYPDKPEEFFKSLQDFVHQKKWKHELDQIGITQYGIRNLLSHERSDLYNTARILTEHDKDEIQFFNIAVRGKGNHDRDGIDNEKHDLFSLFNKKLPFFGKGLSRYHIAEEGSYSAINYLFDRVSDDFFNQTMEGYSNQRSILDEHGKKITERVLKLFLDENKYNVVKEYSNIRVEENIRVDRKFDSVNEKILTDIRKMNLETRNELKVYVDKFIDNLKNIMYRNSKNGNSMLYCNNSNCKNNKPRIDSEIDELIDEICSQAEEENDLQDLDSFVFLVKTAVKNRFKYYFNNIKGDARNNTSAVYKIRKEYEKYEGDFFSGIRTELMSGLGDHSLCLRNRSFDYEKANLEKSVILKDFGGKFDEFKNKMKKVFGNELPKTKKEFERIFEKVTCDELIDFMKSKMEIEIDKNFLRDVLSGFLYNYIDSVYGSVGQANQEKFLCAMRKDFFPRYLGSTFIEQLEKYLRNICNEPEKMLPDYFYDYDSDRSKNCDKPFSPLNCIQTFLYAPLFPDKIFNMSADNCEKLVRNIENARSVIESGSDSKINQLYEKMRGARKQNPNLTYPEIFLNILLDGVNINLTQKEKLDICRAARDFTNNNLDQNLKEHVTQSNLVKIKKGNEFYQKKSGIVVVPAVNIFANGTFNKLLSTNIWSKEYKYSLAHCCDVAWSYFWSYETTGLRILFRICLILFFLPAILFHGISYIIYFCKVGYAFYKVNDRGDVRKFKNPDTIRKGIEEYNKLQEWKIKIKEENKNNNIIVDSEQNNLIKINSGVKNDIDGKIDNNIIDTSSEPKNVSLPLSNSSGLDRINNF